MTKQDTALAYPIITVRRPNGITETISVAAKLRYITDDLFETIKTATAKAGRGEVLSYSNTAKRMAPLPSMGSGWCDRCQSYCYGDCRA